MIQLPFPPGPIRLKSFWLTVSLITGLAIGVLCQNVFALNAFVVSSLVASAWFLCGFFLPPIALFSYRGFNKLSKIFSQQATVLLVSFCFAFLSVVVGKRTSLLRSAAPQELQSYWQLRKSAAVSNPSMGPGISFLETPHQSWATNFVKWALQSGNWSMCTLLPFLLLISVFGEKQDTMEVLGNVYTLY